MAFICLTTTPFLDISSAPLVKLLLTIIGKTSGVIPAAAAKAKIKLSPQSPLVRPLIMNKSGIKIAAVTIKILANCLISRSNKVVFTFLREISCTFLPKTVLLPTAKTMPLPEPETIVVPSYKMLG
ncbi:unknown [Lactobacillus amylovorus CAG:719]|nr:unknown [Lactobacillus amylovorus CAG:719]